MSHDRTRRVQDRAYALWEREGRPHGRHEDHWRQAEQETEGDDVMASGFGQVATEGSPMAQPGAGGTGGVGTEAGGASGGAEVSLGGDRASDAAAAAPGSGRTLPGSQQQGALDPAGPGLGSRGDVA